MHSQKYYDCEVCLGLTLLMFIVISLHDVSLFLSVWVPEHSAARWGVVVNSGCVSSISSDALLGPSGHPW